MKKIFCILALILAITLLPMTPTKAADDVEIEIIETVVIYTDFIHDNVIVLDMDGNVYVFSECDDWIIGDGCELVFINGELAHTWYFLIEGV